MTIQWDKLSDEEVAVLTFAIESMSRQYNETEDYKNALENLYRKAGLEYGTRHLHYSMFEIEEDG